MKKLKQIVFLYPLLFFAFPSLGQQSAENVVVRDVDYLIYFPQDYEAESEKEWPLLIFLHGAGEAGKGVERLKVTGIPQLIEQGHQYPFIIVSPQEQQIGRGWDINILREFTERILEIYPVDLDRVYLTGLSMGGYGTWNFAIASPELFAAIIPICGGTHMPPEMIRRIRRIPVWCFHGDADDVVPLSNSQVIVDALKEVDGNVTFTVYPGVGHDSWTQTYLNPEIYEWLLSHRREKNIPVDISPETLLQYTGTYNQNDERVLYFEVRENQLTIRFSGQEGVLLNAASETEFFYDEYARDLITFEKEPDGNVKGVYFLGQFHRKEE